MTMTTNAEASAARPRRSTTRDTLRARPPKADPLVGDAVQPAASAASLPVGTRSDRGRGAQEADLVGRPSQDARRGTSSTQDEGVDYVSEWDPRLT